MSREPSTAAMVWEMGVARATEKAQRALPPEAVPRPAPKPPPRKVPSVVKVETRKVVRVGETLSADEADIIAGYRLSLGGEVAARERRRIRARIAREQR